MRHAWLATGLLTLTAAAQAAPIELYEQPQLRGAMLGLEDATPRLSDYNFNDRPLSMVVRSGQWLVCTDADYRGQCQVFGPGEYRDLPPGYAAAISSLRPGPEGWRGAGGDRRDGFGPMVGLGGAGAVGGMVGRPATSAYAAAITLYRDGGFNGERVDLTGASPDLRQQGFNDAMSSFEVRSGSWELCEDIQYGGGCRIFGPGRYDMSRDWNDRLSSLRPAAQSQSGWSGVGGTGGWSSNSGLGNTRGGVMLYRDDNGGGDTRYITQATPNLQQQDFNDVASSVEVYSGTWQFCSDANFAGRCITLGPGRHSLVQGMNDQLSSLRPVGGALGQGRNIRF